ncbi:MAG: ATP-dependent DNA helicase [Flavobacteriales bacterium]|nr:ATP-dependent DNA helicase [Flavobacteriales bacterium]|tara:strand:+ start:1990 stop:4386 length:2397 start_codon:yes stop_codon:yes gene_type:complete
MSYLDGLNAAQRAAVEHTEGPSMVIAGAGSGKTRVLTYRIAHLMKKGVDPFNILALTFTNKAAREMKERIANITGPHEAKNLWMGTFHSVFARILRAEAEKLHYPSNFTIYDTQDSKSLLKSIIKELGLDDKVYKVGLVLNRISSAKNNLLSATAYNNNTTIQAEDRQMAKPKIGEIYKLYEQRCFKAAAMDFDDLLFKTNILLRDFPDVLYKYQHRFKYVLVDEYQDTNFSQYLIVKKLAALNENVCVVGDDAQSIYAFRGANIQNILNFQRDYPDCKVFKLEQNYRSTKNIVNAANYIIGNNKDQLEKEVWTENVDGAKIKVSRTLTDNEEGNLVANAIIEIKHNQQADNKDFAILYRTNAQSRAMEEALRKKDVPYKIYGGTSFYQRKEIKDLLAYCRLVINPADDEAIKRVINYPARGIGKTTLDKVTILANERGKSLWEVINSPELANIGVNAGARNKINQFCSMIRSFQALAKHKNAHEVMEEVAKTSTILKDLFSDKSPEGVARYDNIMELLNGVKEFVENDVVEENENAVPIPEDGNEKSLAVFLQDIALLTDADSDDPEDLNKVSLMTIHAAKGLEFPYVFVVGMEENLFPSQLSLNSRSELEEERRLFYVALTRAEKEVQLSYAASRYRWGNLIYCEPSRFIEEIDPRFLEYDTPPEASNSQSFEQDRGSYFNANTERSTQTTFKSRKATGMSQVSKKDPKKPSEKIIPPHKKMVSVDDAKRKVDPSFANTAGKIEEGMRVEHLRFGKGKVTKIEGQEPNKKATIHFDQVGEKQLLLKFAKLRILKNQ